MQILINGLITGLTLAVLVLGFTVVYLPLRVVYLAMGAIYTVVQFAAWAMIVMIGESLRFAAIPFEIAANLRFILYGVLLVVMMHVRPQGIAGDYRID